MGVAGAGCRVGATVRADVVGAGKAASDVSDCCGELDSSSPPPTIAPITPMTTRKMTSTISDDRIGCRLNESVSRIVRFSTPAQWDVRHSAHQVIWPTTDQRIVPQSFMSLRRSAGSCPSAKHFRPQQTLTATSLKSGKRTMSLLAHRYQAAAYRFAMPGVLGRTRMSVVPFRGAQGCPTHPCTCG